MDTRLLETPKNSDDQFKFTFLGYIGFVDTRLKPTRSESVTVQEAAIKDLKVLLLEGSAQRLCLLERAGDGEWLLDRYVVLPGDDLTVLERDTSLPLEFLTQAGPMDESESKTARRGCNEVLSDRVRSAAIQMNPEDDPRCCSIVRDNRFTTYFPCARGGQKHRHGSRHVGRLGADGMAGSTGSSRERRA